MFRRHFARLHRLFAVLALSCIGVVPAHAADPQAALMLVATPEFTHPLYGATVLVAHPIGDGQYLGFIINKPTTVTLGQAFPKHAPSQKVAAPIFLGGPEKANTLFALVHSEQSPGKGSYPIMPGLHVVLAGDTVDAVIENDPDHARFLVGAVFWQKGELDVEIRRGAWYVEQPEADLMMRKETGKLWEELVDRHNGRGKFI
jgi:putative transcriptional regulator